MLIINLKFQEKFGRVMIFREGELDKKIKLAKALLGIPVKKTSK